MGVKHTVLPDGQPPAVAFTVLAYLCCPKANETRWAPPCSPKMVREGTWTLATNSETIAVGCFAVIDASPSNLHFRLIVSGWLAK